MVLVLIAELHVLYSCLPTNFSLGDSIQLTNQQGQTRRQLHITGCGSATKASFVALALHANS